MSVTRYFKRWLFKRNGGYIEGIQELTPPKLPLEHSRLIYDDTGKLNSIEEYCVGQNKPAVKIFGYENPDSSRIVSALDYEPNGSLNITHTYIYDDKGRMIDRIETDGEGRPGGHVESFWNDEEKEIEERWYLPNGALGGMHKYEYDEHGNMIEEKVFNPDESTAGRRVMNYDDAGNLSLKEWYDESGALQSRFTHVYDTDGNITSSCLYGTDGALKHRLDFRYDEFGNPIPLPS